MPKKIEVYECEHCKKKILRTLGGIKQHEKKCFWNPETKSCASCENFIMGGHYAMRCSNEWMNKNSSDSRRNTLRKLQTNCEYHKYDGLTLEERKEKSSAVAINMSLREFDMQSEIIKHQKLEVLEMRDFLYKNELVVK